MLHNQILRHNGHHTIGEASGDWLSANTEADEARIASQMGDSAWEGGVAHHVNDEAVGNETVQEVEGGHWELYTALVEHYSLQWQDKLVEWPKTARELRGRVDRRPLLSAGERMEEDEGCALHAFVSASEDEDDF